MLTGAEQAEFNYQREGVTDQFTRYKGKDGVTLSNFVRRAPSYSASGASTRLISSQIRRKTEAVMERDIASACDQLAPFLQFDADPYPVVLGDRTVWIMDEVHDVRPEPGRPDPERRGITHHVVQLRAQLGWKVTVYVYQGTVTVPRVRQEGPDHPGLPGGVPRPLHRRVTDAAGDQ